MTTRDTINPDTLAQALDNEAMALPSVQALAPTMATMSVLQARAAITDQVLATDSVTAINAELTEATAVETNPLHDDQTVSDSLLTPLDDGSAGS